MGSRLRHSRAFSQVAPLQSCELCPEDKPELVNPDVQGATCQSPAQCQFSLLLFPPSSLNFASQMHHFFLSPLDGVLAGSSALALFPPSLCLAKIQSSL